MGCPQARSLPIVSSDIKICQVYTCGHSEVEGLQCGGLDGSEYVFVEGPCSKLHCSSTDPDWFSEQYTIADPAILNVVADELQNIRVVVSIDLQRFDCLEPMLTDEIAASTESELVDLLIAEERGYATDAYFNLSASTSMLSKARRFTKQRTHRPFFDFCLRQACDYIDDSKTKLEALNDALERLESRESSLNCPTPAVVCRWPGSQGDFEPEFGVEELRLLRLTGEPGQSLLEQPLDAGRLQYSALLVESMKEKLAASSTKPCPTAVEAMDPLSAWLRQEEQAFKFEMTLCRIRSARSKPMRKGPKRALRVNTYSSMMDRRPVSALRQSAR